MKCAECGGQLLKDEVELSRTVGGRDFSTVVNGWRCQTCSTRYYSGPDVLAFEESIAQQLAADGPITGETFAAMRASLKLRSQDVASLLGVAPESISRWENSKRRMDRSAWFILAAAVQDKAEGKRTTLDRLEALRSHAAQP